MPGRQRSRTVCGQRRSRKECACWSRSVRYLAWHLFPPLLRDLLLTFALRRSTHRHLPKHCPLPRKWTTRATVPFRRPEQRCHPSTHKTFAPHLVNPSPKDRYPFPHLLRPCLREHNFCRLLIPPSPPRWAGRLSSLTPWGCQCRRGWRGSNPVNSRLLPSYPQAGSHKSTLGWASHTTIKCGGMTRCCPTLAGHRGACGRPTLPSRPHLTGVRAERRRRYLAAGARKPRLGLEDRFLSKHNDIRLAP